jgi:hypothetical protein
MPRLLIAALVSTMLANALADEIEDQIKLGLESYSSKEYKMAIEDLNYAVAQIQEKLNAQNALLLPEPMEGWKADKVSNAGGAMAMMGSGTQLSRTYRRGGESIKIAIMSGPIIASGLAMINNPMLLGNNPDTSPYRYKRIKGMKKVSGNKTEITLSLAGQVMVQLTAQGLKDEAAIKSYLDEMDFEKIKGALL